MSVSKDAVISKFPNMGTNIFTTINNVAQEYGAINLGQGFPNFDCPEGLKASVQEAIQSGRNQYAPMPGLPELREEISKKISFLYKQNYDPETEITVTPGGHSALTAAALSVVHPGDEVIIFEPCFDCFIPIVKLCGGIPVIIKLTYPNYTVDWSEVKKKITPKTKLIWINTPHNPTGVKFSSSDMQNLIEITQNTNIFILSDEVYEHINFDGQLHESVCRYPELIERSFAVYTFGKVFHTTGWKVGYCVAPKQLMNEFRKIYQMINFTVNHPMQWGIAKFLANKEHYLELPNFYQRKRDLFLNGLKKSRFDFIPAQGSYFQCLTYQKITDLPELETAKLIAKEVKVASIPISSFYSDGTDNGVLRFCFAKTDEVLELATEALCKM